MGQAKLLRQARKLLRMFEANRRSMNKKEHPAVRMARVIVRGK